MYKLNNEFQKLNGVLNCVRDCRVKPTARNERELAAEARPLL